MFKVVSRQGCQSVKPLSIKLRKFQPTGQCSDLDINPYPNFVLVVRLYDEQSPRIMLGRGCLRALFKEQLEWVLSMS